MTGRQRNFLLLVAVLCIGIVVGMPQRIFAQTEETVKIGYYEKQDFQEGCSDTAQKNKETAACNSKNLGILLPEYETDPTVFLLSFR